MFGERIKKKRLCKMDSNFPLFLKYNYDDTHFKLKVTVNEEITEYTQIKEIRESFGNFFIFTKLNQNIFFERFCEFFSTNEKRIYNIKNHQNLYKKELQKGGYTPVEVYLFMKFDFENVFGF